MSKFSKYFMIIGFIIIAVIGIINILYFNVTNFTLTLREEFSPISGGMTLGTGIVAIAMVIQLVKTKREKQSDVASFLIGYFIFTGISATVNGIFSFIEFELVEFDVFFTASTYWFLGIGFMFLLFFNMEVFSDGLAEKKNKILAIVIGIGTATFMIFMVKDMLVSSETTEIIIFGVIQLIIAMFIYAQLVKNSSQLYKYFKREGDNVKKRGFLFLMLSGIFLMLGFLLLLIFQVARQDGGTAESPMNWLSLILLLCGYISLYVGFVYPAKRKEPR